MQAGVHPTLPISAHSQIQIPNATRGAGLRSVKSSLPLTSFPRHASKEKDTRLVFFEIAQVLPRCLHLLSPLLRASVYGDRRYSKRFVPFPIQLHRSWSGNSVMIQHSFNHFKQGEDCKETDRSFNYIS